MEKAVNLFRARREELDMGYQESLIRVSSLAEIAGIEKAIAESEEVQTLEYLVCICGAKAKVDLYRDNTFTASRPLSDIKPNEEPIIRAGDLFAVVAGARLSTFSLDRLHRRNLRSRIRGAHGRLST